MNRQAFADMNRLFKIFRMKVNKNRGFLIMCILVCFALSCSKQKKDNQDAAYNKIAYNQSLDIFPNPERGFIHNAIVMSEGDNLNPSWLDALSAENVTMIMRFYYLEKFKDQPVSEKELQLIQTDMQYLRDAGLKCVLRFAYTDDMSGTDAPLSIIEQHLDQLKPVFEANKDVIAFVQAGFIGAWGEWHSSSNGLATTDNERNMLYKLLSVLPAEIMVQVRTPGAKQQIFGTTLTIGSDIAYTDEKRSRVGHHNDCFLAGGTDYGTYTNILADKEYISKEALYVPTGGETCPPEGTFPACATSQSEMKQLKWTYLNLDWYQPVINAWKNAGCFNEFQRSLGYRLALVSARLLKEVVAEQDFNMEIILTNRGYAPLYNYKTTSLIFKNKTSGNIYPIELPVDLRDCKPNGLLTINNSVKLAGIPQGDYDLYLKISDRSENLKNRIEYSVRLANTDIWDQVSGMNNLKHQVKIIPK
jgi:hypothetical protein